MEWIVEAETLDELIDGRFVVSTKPLIRCRDCKHRLKQQDWKYYDDRGESVWRCGSGHGVGITESVKLRDYCKWAERREQ